MHLFCVNSAAHKHPTSQRWLAAHPRFHMHFTPTHSTWINAWNDNPKPFIGTKTADQVLTSLGRLLQRTSGAGHEEPPRGTELVRDS